MVFEAARRYDAGKPCSVEANAAKLPGGRSGYRASERTVFAHGGFGYAAEFDTESFLPEIWIARLAPVSEQLILNYIAERALDLPKSYRRRVLPRYPPESLRCLVRSRIRCCF